MRAKYDFSKGVRGKYLERYRQGTNLVLLEPDVLQAFPNAESVNRALRTLISVAQATTKGKSRSKASSTAKI